MVYNTKNYYLDIAWINALSVSKSKRDWIEITMYDLRSSANIYEVNVADFLSNLQIKFIHQAPFVFGTKIYFADFYLPDYKLTIEVDGSYHDGRVQSMYDKERDEQFLGIKIRTMRIKNRETINIEMLKLRPTQYIELKK